MNHPLEKKIGHLRGRLWRLAVARAVCWLAVAVLGGIGVLGAIDYWIRFQDPGMRVICSLALLGLWGWVCHRFFYRPFWDRQWRQRLSAVNLAQRVQRTFPQLGDSLASSVEFLQEPEDDPRAGSATLRRAVIAAATANTEEMKFADSLDTRPALRAAVAAVAMCLLAAAVVALDPLWAQVAVARLAYPLSDVRWPQKTYLELIDRVERVAAGGPFEIEVVDAYDARLPTDAKIFYRFEAPDGNIKEENEPMRHLGRSLQARRENVTRPFSYRITGGDDRSMEWIEVEVVEPPAIKTLSLRLTPPPYTAWPPATVDESQAAGFRALAGTKVRMEATVNKPLESVKMRLGEERTVAGSVSENGMRFAVPHKERREKTDGGGFVIERSDAFWFEMTDRQGLGGGEDMRWDIRVIEDRAPTVSIERPMGTVYATPRAAVPLSVLVKDDLAIRRVALVVRLESGKDENNIPAGGERIIVLFEGPQRSAQPAPALADIGARRTIDYGWELDGFKLGGQWLKPGSKAIFYVAAEDYKPLRGKSDVRRLAVITPREMAERIAARQEFILAELARVLKMQRQSRAQVDGLLIRLEETGRLTAADLDRLRGAELGQRQVDKTLAGRTEGVYARVERLLWSLENNRLDIPELRRRMGRLLDEIDRLRNNNFVLIATEMTAAVKSAQAYHREHPPDSTENPDRDTLDALSIVGRNQATVVKTLEGMLARLSQWDNYRRFHREVGQLIRKQENLLPRSIELGRKTLAKSSSDLTPQEAAELRIAAHDEAELARWLDRIVQGMARTAARLDGTDPLAAAALVDALRYINRRSIAARMRSVDDNLRQNRIAQATAGQRRVVEDLQEVLDILSNRRRRELDRLERRLRETEAELAGLKRRQEKAIEETIRLDVPRRAGAALDRGQLARLGRLAREQAVLARDTRVLAEKTAAAGVFRLALSAAAAKMEVAAGRLGRQATGQETQSRQRDAERRLGQMLEALKSAKNEQKKSAGGGGTGGKGGGQGKGQEIKLLAQLKLFKMLQREINEQTQALEQLYGGTPAALPQPARRAYAELAEEQRRLADLMRQLLPADVRQAFQPDM